MRMIPIVFVILAFVLSLSGCSAIGFVIGATFDSGNPGRALAIPAEVDSLAPGTNLRILKKDLTEIKGTFGSEGLVRDDKYANERYPQEFERWRSETRHVTSSILPYGTSLRIVVRRPQGEKIYDGSFAGFDPGVIRIITHPEGKALGIMLEYVRGVFDSLGRSVATSDLLFRTGEGVPFASRPGIILHENPNSGIPFDDIKEVNLLESGSGRWIGLVTGAALDVAAIYYSLSDLRY